LNARNENGSISTEAKSNYPIPSGARSVEQFLYRILCGFLLGIGLLAPGFSGSVIAIIMGVYQDLIRILSNPFKNIKANIKFMIPLMVGAIVAAIAFFLSFNWLFDNFEKAVYFLFIGLIAANLPIIFKEVKAEKFTLAVALSFVGALAFAVGLGLFVAEPASSSSASASIPALSYPLMIIGGAFTGASTVIPGMDSSVVMVILGIYQDVIAAGRAALGGAMEALPGFAVFALFAVVGLVLVSRVIDTIFKKNLGVAYSLVLGFMSGSLITVTVDALRMPDVNFNWMIGALMIAVGVGMSIVFVIMGNKLEGDGDPETPSELTK
jgi:putative membrane protein